MIDLDSLLPDCYARFRPLLSDALGFFLAELPEPRRAAIIAEQQQLPASATPALRAVALLRHSALLHKLGQVMARNAALAPELRTRLQQLESLPPSLGAGELGALIESELGADARHVELGQAPLAEGSVAVVMPFRLREPAPPAPTEGVFKVLKPGIEHRVEEELGVAARLGDYLAARSEALDLPPLDYRKVVGEIADMLRRELELGNERKNLDAAASLYACSKMIRVPRLLPFTGGRLTAMERIHGVKVTDAPGLDPRARRTLARRLAVSLVATPFFGDQEPALFHGDPHAGNLLLDGEGRIVPIDWSLCARLDGDVRHAVVAAVVAAMTLNRPRLRRSLSTLMGGAVDPALLDREIERALAGVPWQGLPGLDWLVTLCDRLAEGGAGADGEFIVFRKSLFTLEGVLNDLSSAVSASSPMARFAVAQFYRELTARMIDLGGRRRFGIQLSNRELMQLAAGWPLTVGRYWAHGLGAIGHRMAHGSRGAASSG